MNSTIQKKKREECFKNYINEILINREVDCDEEWWTNKNAQKELTELASAQKNYITDSQEMNIGGAETLVFAVYKDSEDTFVDKVKRRISSLSHQSKFKESDILLVFFVRDMKSRVFLEKTFRRNIVCILIQDYVQQEMKLRNLKRYVMLQEPPISGKVTLEKRNNSFQSEKNMPIKGLVCTIDLWQIVELYNMLGDQIFKYNVRIGMKETLGVDSAIRNTLEKEPDCFWFKNNGITILVENPDFKTNNAEELLLDWIEPGKELQFSVVNGAQTINTAAQYFYELTYQLKNSSASEKEEIEKKLKCSKKANVLLRLIHISVADEVDKSPAMAREISVALNRQKPIKIEDVAFATPFVEKLTKYLASNSVRGNDLFQLVRRGEKTDKKRQMDLVEFSRARLACIGFPGKARNQGANKFLSYQSEENKYSFMDKTIFTENWLNADDSNEDKIFQQDYKAVWYAHRIALEYDKVRRTLKKSEQDIQNVIQNGKWYFTAFLIHVLNDPGCCSEELYSNKPSGENFPDFSNFACDLNNILNNIPQAMECFAEIIVFYIKTVEKKGKYGEPDSNLFKSDNLYKDVIRELKEIKDVTTNDKSQQLLLEKYQKFVELSQQELCKETLNEDTAEASDERNTYAEKHVILNGEKILVQSDAHALQVIVKYVLETFLPNGKWLSETEGWITDNKETAQEGRKYFRGTPKEINVNGKNYWVGTHSNVQIKRHQIKQLCELAKVPKSYIVWYKNSQEEPEFSW